jgi:hypothetical protein
MKKIIKPLIIGAIFGALIMPVSVITFRKCASIIPGTYTDGYWNTAICDFLGFILSSLSLPIMLISNPFDDLLSGIAQHQDSFATATLTTITIITFAIFYALLFLGIQKAFLFIKRLILNSLN